MILHSFKWKQLFLTLTLSKKQLIVINNENLKSAASLRFFENHDHFNENKINIQRSLRYIS